MKLIFLTVCLILFFASSGFIIAQAQVDTLYLNEAQDNLGLKNVRLSAGGYLVFASVSGDFAIIIYDADSIFDIDEENIDIVVTESAPSLAYRVLQLPATAEKVYYVYSFGNNTWPPDAPPRIIIRVK